MLRAGRENNTQELKSLGSPVIDPPPQLPPTQLCGKTTWKIELGQDSLWLRFTPSHTECYTKN